MSAEPDPTADDLDDLDDLAERPPADTYGTGEAARVLGLSDRRVRQLVTEGHLPAGTDNAGVLRLPQQAVHEERARRRAKRRAPDAAATPQRSSADPEALAAALAAVVGQFLAGQRELTAQAASLVDAERARFEAERLHRLALEVELAELRARLAVTEATPGSADPAERRRRRRWWRGAG